MCTDPAADGTNLNKRDTFLMPIFCSFLSFFHVYQNMFAGPSSGADPVLWRSGYLRLNRLYRPKRQIVNCDTVRFFSPVTEVLLLFSHI